MSKMREYVDFKLYLAKAAGLDDETPSYQVSLLPTPEVGESILPVSFSTAVEGLDEQLELLRTKMIPLRKLVGLGKTLASWLLPTGIRELFTAALKQAGNEGGVRLRLILADHSLKGMPWEYIYFDPDDPNGENDTLRGFLALNPLVSIVRHEPLASPHPKPFEASGSLTKLKMLVATASPSDQKPLGVAKEEVNLRTAVRGVSRDNLTIELPDSAILSDATFEEVENALTGLGSAHIFHFAGHGISKPVRNPVGRGKVSAGFLIFLDEDFKDDDKLGKRIQADALAKRLQAAGVFLVTLGACQTAERSTDQPWLGVAGSLVAHQIPAVVAMQYEVLDTEAVAFSKTFYEGLERGLSLDEAMSWSRIKMAGSLVEQIDKIPNNVEWGVPTLYSRLPDGVLVPELVKRGERSGTAAEARQKIEVDINQKLGIVKGAVTGVEANLAKATKDVEINITQEADTVEESGSVTGATLDFG